MYNNNNLCCLFIVSLCFWSTASSAGYTVELLQRGKINDNAPSRVWGEEVCL